MSSEDDRLFRPLDVTPGQMILWAESVTRDAVSYLECDTCGWVFPLETTADDECCTQCDGHLSYRTEGKA